MTQNKRDYLKEVFSLDLTYDFEAMFSARRKFLEQGSQISPAQIASLRQHGYWELQDLRHQFWGYSQEERNQQIKRISKDANAELSLSLAHLQKIALLEEDIKKAEEDLTLDPVFVERLKLRLLHSDKMVPGSLELRTMIPAKSREESKLMRRSVAVLRSQYQEIAQHVPRWLDMIATSRIKLLTHSQNETYCSNPSYALEDAYDQSLSETVRSQIETNKTNSQGENNESEEAMGAGTVLMLLIFGAYWIMKAIVFASS